MNFDKHFSQEAIVKHLCNKRILEANTNHEVMHIARLMGTSLPHAQRPSRLGQLLPPRSKWSRFRPRFRSGDSDYQSLVLATTNLLKSSHAPWVENLNGFITQLKHNISTNEFQFSRPTIKWERKKDNTYRSLAIFKLEDSVVCSLLSRYLTATMDNLFSDSSYAFRADSKKFSRDSAINQIYKLRQEHKELYVAECDIQGFYDCISHDRVKKIYLDETKRIESKKGIVVSDIATKLFFSYLDCYNFPDSIVSEAQPRLTARNPNGKFKWPDEELAKLLKADPFKAKIGVPQGGALSTFIANLVLNVADTELDLISSKYGDVWFFRFCDDIIILSTSKSHCNEALQAYLKTLRNLKLPVHKPNKVWTYGKSFWETKSKKPFAWSGKKWFNCVPWIQFLGYQIRYDGLMRVRKESIDKQKKKIRTSIDNIKFSLLNHTRRGRKIESNRYSVILSTYYYLTASAIGKGRNRLVTPKSWVQGFRVLFDKPTCKSTFKQIDRIKEHQARRLKRANIKFGKKSKGNETIKETDHEFTNSYYAQYKDNGGAKLVSNPYKPSSILDRLRTWIFKSTKIICTHVKKYI